MSFVGGVRSALPAAGPGVWSLGLDQDQCAGDCSAGFELRAVDAKRISLGGGGCCRM
jgi:hypothetical protein